MRRRLLVASLASLIVAGLGWYLREFVRETVVVPLLYASWIAQLVVGMLPQALVWAIFLVIAVYVAVRSLRGRRAPAREELGPETRQEGPVARWSRQIELATRGSYSRWRLAHQLGHLSVEALAYRGQLASEQVQEQLKKGKLELPPEVRVYLQAGLEATSHRTFLTFDRRSQSAGQRSPFDVDLEHVVQFLEAQLEVHGER
ncbi:MAG: hypothetical protein MAG451_02494 [Anaerolineales bacterium]|nr:hypothetical protein [Anaerolineales bacterium]